MFIKILSSSPTYSNKLKVLHAIIYCQETFSTAEISPNVTKNASSRNETSFLKIDNNVCDS